MPHSSTLIYIMKKITTGIAALMLIAGGTLFAQSTANQTTPKQETNTTTQQGSAAFGTQNNSTTNNAINPTGQRNTGMDNTNQALKSSTQNASDTVNNSTTN